MKNTIAKIITTVMVGAIVLALVIVTGYQSTKSVDASGQTISPWASYATTSGDIITSASSMVSATNTARVYLRISNLSSFAIYCNMISGSAAVAYKGLTIFASSTYEIKVDENPYRGAVTCIAPTGSASTTIIEE